MNREDIIKLARGAGAAPYINRHYPDRPVHTFTVEQLERFFHAACAAGASDENEACAKVADEWQLGVDDPRYQKSCADAIRARGQG